MPWSSWLLLPSNVVLSTGKVNSLSGPATATGGLLFSAKLVFSVWHFLGSHWQGLPIRFCTGYFNKILIDWLKRYKPQVWHGQASKWERSALQQAKYHSKWDPKSHSKYFLFHSAIWRQSYAPKNLAACSMHYMKCQKTWVVGILLVPPIYPFQNLPHKYDSLLSEKILTHSVCCSRPLS